MFRGKKRDEESSAAKSEGQAGSSLGDAEGLSRGFLREGTAAPSRPSAQPDIMRRPPDLSAYGTRREQTSSSTAKSGDGKQLIVGRDIALTGEIRTCEVLIVEGKVEASLSDCRVMEIAQSGHVKGTAIVDTAEISGEFEGDLTVQKNLIVRATGRLQGNIRYRELEVERGGSISGTIEAMQRDPSSE